MKRKIGRQEAQVLAYAQMRKLRVVRTGDLREPLKLTARQECKVLSRLSQAGMIARVWRGVYLVPPRLPLGGKWSPGEFLALDTLMATVGPSTRCAGPMRSTAMASMSRCRTGFMRATTVCPASARSGSTSG